MRISDWSSDVCSSDLQYLIRRRLFGARARTGGDAQIAAILIALAVRHHGRAFIYVVHLVHASGRIWHAPPEGQEHSADKSVRTDIFMFKMQTRKRPRNSRRGRHS